VTICDAIGNVQLGQATMTKPQAVISTLGVPAELRLLHRRQKAVSGRIDGTA
jgi:hypothetical protein